MISTFGLAAGVLLAAIAAVAVAIQSVSVRLGTNEGRAADALVVVLFANVVTIVPAAVLIHAPAYSLTVTSVVAFAAAGIAGTLLGRIFYYTSIERIGASRSEPLKASQPLHATLIAVLVLGEVVTAVHVVGILLIVVGVAAITWETARSGNGAKTARKDSQTAESDAQTGGNGTQTDGSGTQTDGSDTQAGENRRFLDLLFPLAAAFFFGIEPTLAKLGFAEGTPILVGLAIKTVVASGGFLAYLRYRNELPDLADLRSRNARWYLLAGGANTTFLLLYYLALSVSPVSVVVPIIQTSPLVVMVLSVLFLSRLERVTWRLVAGAAVVVGGAVVLTAVA